MFSRYVHYLKKTVFWLSIFWSIYEVIYYIKTVWIAIESAKFPEGLLGSIYVFEIPNAVFYAIYMVTMFRLKTLEIYIAPENTTVIDIQT